MRSASVHLSRRTLSLAIGAALAMSAGGVLAQAKAAKKPLQGEVVKMVRIDPLSGLLGPVGISQRKGYEFFAEKFSASNPAGVKFEIELHRQQAQPHRKPERAQGRRSTRACVTSCRATARRWRWR